MLEIVSQSACVAQCVSAVAVCTRIFVLPQTFNFDSVIDEATFNAGLSIYQFRSAATADIKRHDAPSLCISFTTALGTGAGIICYHQGNICSAKASHRLVKKKGK
jgi:hypothetical protein